MLTKKTLTAFENLRSVAHEFGFAPKIESGYRSFERQLVIWNEKAEGKRKILDSNGRPFNRAELSDLECMKAILLWSALPGTSRHEWGTDIDVFDSAAVPENYEVQLTPEEADGVFGKFHAWLDGRILRGEAFGFRRVFLPPPNNAAGEVGEKKTGRLDVVGVQPERWHLSYAPESSVIEQSFNSANLAERLRSSGILLLPQILENLDWILEKYVKRYFLQYPTS